MENKISKQNRKYKNYTLDDFQVEAIESLDNNHSVLVSAATGTGKTLIADYVINKYLPLGKKIIYTAPIKALSNQKYKEFKAEYGDNVGIVTGDVVINPEAPIIIMTTEIYRNLLVTHDESVEHLSYVIFDEIHFINDIERGTVWEESIIFSPNHVRFLALSATVPNAKEFADWIQTVKKHPVDVIKYEKRAVPLEHFVYDYEVGMTTAEKYLKTLNEKEKDVFDAGPEVYGRAKTRGGRRGTMKNQRPHYGQKPKSTFRVAKHYQLLEELEEKKLMPCIFFVFSRKACEEKARELRQDYSTKEDKSEILKVFRKYVSQDYYKMQSVKLLREVLPKGIGVHHAGLLPGLKSAVEELFNKGLIKVLYTTETFAVGINMPAKCVAFSSLEKYDGISFRYLNSKEYFQMAGRAGRRGLDKIGYSIALIDKKYNDFEKVVSLTSKDTDPIISQFKLSYNTVLNLLNNYNNDSEMIERIMKSSFDYYLKKKKNRNIRIMASFNNYVKRLKKFEYVDNFGNLTEKGDFARYIYSNELLLTEIFYTDMFYSFSPTEIIALLAAIIYEPRKNDKFGGPKKSQEYNHIIKVISKNQFVDKQVDRIALRKILPTVIDWANGADFIQIMEYTNRGEGDIIRLIRQIVDFLRQIIRATREQEKLGTISDCINMMYKDVIKAEF